MNKSDLPINDWQMRMSSLLSVIDLNSLASRVGLVDSMLYRVIGTA